MEERVTSSNSTYILVIFRFSHGMIGKKNIFSCVKHSIKLGKAQTNVRRRIDDGAENGRSVYLNRGCYMPARGYEFYLRVLFTFDRAMRRGGLMVSALDSGASGFEPWPGTLCCALGQDTSLTVPLSTQVYKWAPANLMLGVTLRWTSIPSRGSRNTPSRFMLLKPR